MPITPLTRGFSLVFSMVLTMTLTMIQDRVILRSQCWEDQSITFTAPRTMHNTSDTWLVEFLTMDEDDCWCKLTDIEGAKQLMDHYFWDLMYR